MQKHKVDILKDDLHDLYITKNLRRKDIAEYYQCSESLIVKKLNEFGIIKDKENCYSHHIKRQTKICSVCGKEFDVILSRVDDISCCSSKCKNLNKMKAVVLNGVKYKNLLEAIEKTGMSENQIRYRKDK